MPHPPASDPGAGPRSPLAHPLLWIILAGLAVRVALTPLYANLPNGLLDEGFWKHWMENIQRDGFLNIFRSTNTDYVGYHWVLWGLAAVYDVIGGPYTQTTPSLHILVKMPSLAFDVVLIAVVYRATAMLCRSEGAIAGRMPLAAAAVIAFHPAVLYDSAVWAQTDSAITAAMLGALLLASSARPLASGAAMALGLAVKPHPVIAGPLLLLMLLRNGGARAVMLAAAGVAIVAALVLGPWIIHGDLGNIIDVYRTLFGQSRGRLSELAWNVGWIFDTYGDPRPGDAIFGGAPWLTFRRALLALSLVSAAVTLAYAYARPGLRGTLIAAAYQAFAFYLLPVASHERYLYPFLGFLLPVALLDRRWLWLYVPVSLTFTLNLLTVAPPADRFQDRWVYSEFGAWVAMFHTAAFAAFTGVLVHGVVGWWKDERAPYGAEDGALAARSSGVGAQTPVPGSPPKRSLR